MKVKVASAAIGGTKSMSQLSSDHGVHVSQIKEWKTQALEAMRERFSSRRGRKKRDEVDESRLYEEIGRLKVELDFLKGKLGN
jgi:transposase-like protein